MLTLVTRTPTPEDAVAVDDLPLTAAAGEFFADGPAARALRAAGCAAECVIVAARSFFVTPEGAPAYKIREREVIHDDLVAINALLDGRGRIEPALTGALAEIVASRIAAVVAERKVAPMLASVAWPPTTDAPPAEQTA